LSRVPATLPFVLVTGNAGKLAEARRLAGAHLEAVAIDLPEIQSLDLLAVLHHKGEEAWRRLGRPLVVEEAGFELAAFNGFPGPLVKWMLDAAGAETIARSAHSLGNSRAVARAALYYRDATRTLVAEGYSAGTLVLPPRGTGGFGWDPVFCADEIPDRTMGEVSGAEKDAVSHRGRAWRALLGRLYPPHLGA
jgi:XTP/dITP diphosphohydrolase